MTTPKFKVGDRVKWRDCEGRELSGAVTVAADERVQITVMEHGDGRFVARWHESHLSLDVPEAAKATKFKVGDRVKWRDCEGRELSGAVMVAADERGQITVREHRDELFVARWHESHLSLDVPEPKHYATDLEVQLGIEITNLTQTFYAQRREMTETRAETELLVRMAAVQSKGRMEDRDQIERLQRIGNKQAEAYEHLSSSLTEEIGGRHRERIAKEAALTGEALALDSLREIAKTLGDQPGLTAQGLREKTPALAKCEMKRLEAAQKELAQTRENEIWCCNKLSELANELSAERVAKKSAQKELADLRWALKEISK